MTVEFRDVARIRASCCWETENHFDGISRNSTEDALKTESLPSLKAQHSQQDELIKNSKDVRASLSEEESEYSSWGQSSSLSTSPMPCSSSNSRKSSPVFSDSGYAPRSGSKCDSSSSSDLESSESAMDESRLLDCRIEGQVDDNNSESSEHSTRDRIWGSHEGSKGKRKSRCQIDKTPLLINSSESAEARKERNECISFLISNDVIGCLTSEGVAIYADMQIFPTSYHLKRLHLIVVAIQEILTLVETEEAYFTEQEQQLLNDLKRELAKNEELHVLLRHLILSYNSGSGHSKTYLVDLIVTIHRMFLLLDDLDFDLRPQIQHFATVQVMASYGEVLNDFKRNSNYVNESVLTMMHHVAGELDSICILFQPNIIRTFCAMAEYNKIVDVIQWEELIHYVLHEFYRNNLLKDTKNDQESPKSSHFDCQMKDGNGNIRLKDGQVPFEKNKYSISAIPDWCQEKEKECEANFEINQNPVATVHSWQKLH